MNGLFKIVLIIILLMSFLIYLTSCRKVSTELIVTTGKVTVITQISAISGGNVISDGGSEVTFRGTCWDTAFFPTISKNKTIDGSGLGSFTSNITQLTPNTLYYLRAYASNSAGTVYGNQVNFTTTSNSEDFIRDIDGNIYYTITIGAQTWMKENLKTTRDKYGTDIPLVTNNAEWYFITTPGYCSYNNEVNNKETYGALYNWYAVETGNLCPTGWHVPTDSEWETLITYLGGDSIALCKLKEAGINHWHNPNTGATNKTGFSALPGGCRDYDGTFYFIGYYGYWWSSTEFIAGGAWCRYMGFDGNGGYRHGNFENDGFSVRCLRDQ